jgi:hypothetical protein
MSHELDNVFTHKPRTVRQQLAANEFQALGSLYRIRAILSSLRGTVPEAVLVTLGHASTRGIDHITAQQLNRKKARLQKELAAMEMLPDPLAGGGIDEYVKELIK